MLYSKVCELTNGTYTPVPLGYCVTYNIDEHLTGMHDKGVVTFPVGIPNPGTVLMGK